MDRASTPQSGLLGSGGLAAAKGTFEPASWPVNMLAASVLVLGVVAAYCNSLAGAFLYDDLPSIVANPTIRHLWPIGQALTPPCDGQTVSGRPLLNLSLAINYALGGFDVRGYHVANLLIHIVAGLLLLGILRRTFLLPALRDRFGKAATPLALAGAMLWALHPLQTESVTYIIQRAESLAGFFYFLTLYCVIRGAGSAGVPPAAADAGGTPALRGKSEKGDCPPRPHTVWYAAAILACLLGMATKEIMVTAPVIVLLCDRVFLAGSFGGALRRRWALYLGLAATWTLLGYLVLSTALIGRQAELGAPDVCTYARTQPGVILYYLWLAVWPRSLCLFYHGWPVATGFWDMLPGTMVLVLLLAATVWGLIKRKAWGFLGAWFLLILAPTSSFQPLNQLVSEHRMYLPLAAIAVLVTAGGYAIWDELLASLRRPGVVRGGQSPFSPGPNMREIGLPTAKKGTVPMAKKWAVAARDTVAPSAALSTTLLRWGFPAAVLAGVLTALGLTTARRNCDYQSALSIWQDGVNKRPTNPIAQNNLGKELADLGKFEEAIAHCRESLRLKPDNAEAHHNLGRALAAVRRTDEAIQQYRQALQLKPMPEVHNNLGNALAAVGKTDEAIAQFQEALRLKPEAEIHNNLGDALAAAGRFQQAIEHWQEVVRLQPDHAVAHHNLGNALDLLGRPNEAIDHFREALRLKSNYAAAHYNLGRVLPKVGRTQEAIEHLQRALDLRPDDAKTHYCLAHVLAGIGMAHEAIEHYRQALQRAPKFPLALQELAWLLATSAPQEGGDPARAVHLAQRARELVGHENAECLDTLAAAYAAAGRFDDAVLTAERAAQLAESSGQAVVAKNIQSRLELYRAGRPYREPPRSAPQPKP